MHKKKTEKRKENLLLYKNIIFFLREREKCNKKRTVLVTSYAFKEFYKNFIYFFSHSQWNFTQAQQKQSFWKKRNTNLRPFGNGKHFCNKKTNQCHLHFIIIFTKEKNVRLKGFLTNHCFGAPF